MYNNDRGSGSRRSRHVEGYVDKVTTWGASGWTWVPGAPDQTVEVEAVVDDVVIGRATADALRPDLEASGRGTGRYGFTLSFERALGDGDDLSVRTSDAHGSISLQMPSAARVEGYVDKLTRAGVSGWAWVPSAPEEVVQVEAVLDGTVIGRSAADQMREDIKNSGRGSGFCGFSMSFDRGVEGDQPPLIRAISAQGPRDLPGAGTLPNIEGAAPAAARPDPILHAPGLSHPRVEGHIDHLCRGYATGWAWIPEAPDEVVAVEAVLGGLVVGRADANQMRQDLTNWGRGTGRYGFHITFHAPLTGSVAPLLRSVPSQGSYPLAGHKDLPPAGPLDLSISIEPAKTSAVEQGSPALVEGHVDYLTRWSAKGWAWMPGAPEQAVKIEAWADDRFVGAAIADDMREDLAQAGKGTGRYGFNLTFDGPLKGDSLPVLRTYVAAPDSISGVHSLPPVTQAELTAKPRGTVETLLAEHALFTSAGPEFEEFDPTILEAAKDDSEAVNPLLMAFYLPQFHPIKENDQFWGKGFTEWRQLPRGVSRFPGHYQPRIPRDLGFYDLNDVEVLRRQSDQAKAAGVGAFAYYYYWFNTQRVLEKPLDMLIESDVDMPFLLIWANENWTRTWDGSESEVLLRQDYREEDEDALIADLARHLLDRRYVRLNGRPLLIIYNPKHIPDAPETLARWREQFRLRHQIEPLIFMAQTFGELDPTLYGLDGAIEFPPHKLSNTLPGRPTPDAYGSDFVGRVIDYDDFANVSLAEGKPDFPLIKTIVPSWDNECRRPNRGLSLEGVSPVKYEAWLGALIEKAYDDPIEGVPVVAINAWNEWAEAAYLEPDVHFGSAFLNATARAYAGAVDAQRMLGRSSEKVSVILPNYNHASFLRERIASVLGQSVVPDEIIFLDDCSSDDSVALAEEILASSGVDYKIVLNETNSGCVFKQWTKGIEAARNDLVWIAETDDSADKHFLKHILPNFRHEHVMAAFGRITCIDEDGSRRGDLDGYFDELRDFSWKRSTIVPAYRAFSWDFTIRNVIPNASGLVFRRLRLEEAELERLYRYRFAGDWYFYALMLRGGAVAYSRNAVSYFRVRSASTSRSAFFTEQHLLEHRMIIRDLQEEYAIDEAAMDAHADALAVHFPSKTPAEVRKIISAGIKDAEVTHPLRICIAAHSFEVGGGEVLPLELANGLKSRGYHVTYLVMERSGAGANVGLRGRLRRDIPVVYWEEVQSDFSAFLDGYGIQLLNSHNVSIEFQLALSQIEIPIPYIASLHGGYETVPDILTDDFIAYINKTVDAWLYLAEKNTTLLLERGADLALLERSFNAVPPLQIEKEDRAAFRMQRGIPEDAFVLILCSRAITDKGWQRAIDAVAKAAPASEKPLHLILIGDGPALPELQAANAAANFVTFLGHVDSPSRFLHCADMGIFPSTFSGETFPLFLLECFQAGIPVITTDIGEIPRIMGSDADARPGMMVRHDQAGQPMIQQMAAQVAKACNDPYLYEGLRANASATSDRFSMDRLLDYYERTLKRHVVRPRRTEDSLSLGASDRLYG